jgi:hypothetical protein
MPVKVKELRDGSVIKIELNKNFYLMLKGVLLYILKIEPNHEKLTALVEKITKAEADKEPHTEQEAAFKTMLYLLAEIEGQASIQGFYDEIEVPSPGDDNYVEPTQG